MQPYLITVLVPVYNHSSYLRETISSVVAQTMFASAHVIISDDRSSDDSYTLALNLAAKYDNISVRQNDVNLGVMGHYSRLLEDVTTPFFCILEGDDAWLDNKKLATQMDLMNHWPSMIGSFTAYEVCNPPAGISFVGPRARLQGRSGFVYFEELLEDNQIATFSNCMYRTEEFRRLVASLDYKKGYDWLVNLAIAAQHPLGFVGRVATRYRLHSSGTWTKLSEKSKRLALLATLSALLEAVPTERRALVENRLSRLVS